MFSRASPSNPRYYLDFSLIQGATEESEAGNTKHFSSEGVFKVTQAVYNRSEFVQDLLGTVSDPAPKEQANIEEQAINKGRFITDFEIEEDFALRFAKLSAIANDLAQKTADAVELYLNPDLFELYDFYKTSILGELFELCSLQELGGALDQISKSIQTKKPLPYYLKPEQVSQIFLKILSLQEEGGERGEEVLDRFEEIYGPYFETLKPSSSKKHWESLDESSQNKIRSQCPLIMRALYTPGEVNFKFALIHRVNPEFFSSLSVESFCALLRSEEKEGFDFDQRLGEFLRGFSAHQQIESRRTGHFQTERSMTLKLFSETPHMRALLTQVCQGGRNSTGRYLTLKVFGPEGMKTLDSALCNSKSEKETDKQGVERLRQSLSMDRTRSGVQTLKLFNTYFSKGSE